MATRAWMHILWLSTYWKPYSKIAWITCQWRHISINYSCARWSCTRIRWYNRRPTLFTLLCWYKSDCWNLCRRSVCRSAISGRSPCARILTGMATTISTHLIFSSCPWHCILKTIISPCRWRNYDSSVTHAKHTGAQHSCLVVEAALVFTILVLWNVCMNAVYYHESLVDHPLAL